jgi:hypothetical protein
MMDALASSSSLSDVLEVLFDVVLKVQQLDFAAQNAAMPTQKAISAESEYACSNVAILMLSPSMGL